MRYSVSPSSIAPKDSKDIGRTGFFGGLLTGLYRMIIMGSV